MKSKCPIQEISFSQNSKKVSPFSLLIPILFALLFVSPTHGQKSETPNKWQKDIAHLASELPKRHKNLFFRIKESDWTKLTEATSKALAGKPSDAKFIIETMRLLAAVGDSHTTLNWRKAGLATMPLQFMDFEEGLFVYGFPANLPKLKGLRITAIDGKAIDEIRAMLKPLIAADNDAHLGLQTIQLLSVPALLHAAGACTSPEGYEITGVSSDGQSHKVAVKATPAGKRRGVMRAFAFSKFPLCLNRGRVPYWTRDLQDAKALYLKYNKCRNQNQFDGMMRKVWPAIDAMAQEGTRLDKLIVDMRHNRGGDSRVIRPLVAELQKRKQYRGDNLVVIIGRHTFSSAILNALELQRKFNAKLIGEPTAGKPNHYGEIRPLELPATGLSIFYSTKYFKNVTGDPQSLTPDVTLKLKASEFFAGQDAFLEAATKNDR